jgi:RNA polymerase sigma-70 factor (ECF subfamily)
MQAQIEVSREVLFNELAIDLKKFIARRVPNSADVEDVLQETLIKIHRSIGCLAPNSNLYAWVYKVTRNAIIDHHRRQQANSHLDPLHALPEDFAQKAVSRDVLGEIAPCLRPMLDYLPEKYAEAVRLSDLEDVPQAELAKRLGLSLSGAKSRVQRGREQLKTLLADCCRFEFDCRGKVVDYTCNKKLSC